MTEEAAPIRVQPGIDEVAVPKEHDKAKRILTSLVGQTVHVRISDEIYGRYSVKGFDEGKNMLELSAQDPIKFHETIYVEYFPPSPTRLIHVSRGLYKPRRYNRTNFAARLFKID